jgi:glycosyltransferase involved in cell wall biosynthesis/GT2 family glycosyltransferase
VSGSTHATTSEASGPILLVSYSSLWGGAERILLDMAAGLERPPVLLCPSGGLAAHARDAGLPVLARPDRPRELRGGAPTRARAVLGLAAHARDIRSAAASLRPSLIVAWGMRSAIAAAAALAGGRDRPPLAFEHVDFLPSRVVGRVIRTAAGRAQSVIALSSAVAADLDPLGRLGARLKVVAPGVDPRCFRAAPPPRDPPVAITLGAITAWKRPDLALEAVAIASKALPGLRLIVAGHSVGEASERLLDELRRRAAQPDLAGRVEFAGALADPRPALERASCLLHCSDHEPFGLVLLEAMASGRPVLAPASGGPREIVADGCGRLFSPGDAGAAADALVETLGDGDRLRQAGKRARAHVAENFSLSLARRSWLEALPKAPAAAAGRAGERLTLVTVSHDSEPELCRLLSSVRRHLPAAQMVVMDSGSRDGSVEVARRAGARVTVRALNNVGYGRAVNAGMRLVTTPACVILNPDIELVDDSLAGLAAETLRPDTPERLLAPLVLHPDGMRQDSVHREPLSPAAVAVALLPPAVLPPIVRRRIQPWRGNRPRPVAWAVGCCVAGRTDSLRRLGPFDERIFLYAEDMELGLRAGDAGVKTWWWPTARVIHHEAHSTERAFGGEAFDLLARQRHAVVAERRGEGAARWDDRLQAALLLNRIALKTVLARSRARERGQLRALGAARGARL